MGGFLGGKKGSSKQTTKSNDENTNWLMKNAAYTGLANQGITEGSQMTIPGLQNANYSQQFYANLNDLANGVDLSDYARYQGFYDTQGKSMLNQGQEYLGGATDVLSRIQNMSGEDWQKDFNQEYNSDFVKSRISQVSDIYNEQKNASIQSLNQGATQSGNMGSSRAGVAQGVIESQAAKNIASATTDIQAQEEAAAEQRLMNRYGLSTGAAGQMAGIGQQSIATGLNLTGQGYGVYQAGNQAQIANWTNALNAGQTQQEIEQQNLDIARQNAMMAQSPSLQRLGYMNQFLGPMANYQTYGTNTSTTTTQAAKKSPWGTVLGAVGTGVGAYFGGPVGAQIGGSIGGMVGSQF
ncbi:hypothetical protein IGV50_004415 [Salmonella enterica subsp. enterica serovar Newport]|nr:hypothetical protein [Salmonella enterica subsp. enterica serovar Newport]